MKRGALALAAAARVAATAAALFTVAGCGGDSSKPGGTYRLRGTVTGRGQPLAGARVRVQGSSDTDGPAFVATAADGSFVLDIAGHQAGDRVVVTAGIEGYKSAALVDTLPAGGGPSTVNLSPIPTDDATYGFQSVEYGDPPCNFCHFDQIDKWSASQHSRAARDPLPLDEYRVFAAWWQKLDPYATSEAAAFAGPFLPSSKKGDTGAVFDEGVARYRVAGDDATLGDCAKCHTPTYAAGGGQDFRPSVLASKAKVFSEGVACDFCHKVQAVKTATEMELTAVGIDKVTFARPGAMDQVMFGPYDDITYVKMQSSYSTLVQKSELCADCHSDARRLSLQPVDAAGAPTGSPILRLVWGEDTYREWRFAAPSVVGVHTAGSQSATGDGAFSTAANYAGKPLQCQDCHMQDPPPDPVSGERIAGWADPAFNDARIATNDEAVKRDPRTVHPHRFQGRTARFIAWATELSATARREGGDVVVDVTVENRHTGHDFPSGLPDRNVLLEVSASDASGALLQGAGPTLPAWASGDGVTDRARDLAGQPGKGYARVLAAADGETPVFYLRAVRDGDVDTRLRPGGKDTSTYRFPSKSGAATVLVKLVHRLRFKGQIDHYLRANPGADPASFETLGDSITVVVP